MTLVGVGYRPEISGLCHGENAVVDCVELIADRYLGATGFNRSWELRQLSEVPTIIHGLCGNAASVHGPDAGYLGQIRRLADAIGAIACSDHLAFTRVAGRDFGHLAPNLFDDELVDAATRNIERIVDVTGRRICLENLATKTMISGSAYSPEEYYLRLLEASDQWDCLLDLTNLWLNSRNRSVDPVRFIDELPPDRIGYVHLAGGVQVGDEWIDSHSQAVHAEVFELLEHLVARAAPAAIIIERDKNWSGAETELRADLNRVRRILAAGQEDHDVRPCRTLAPRQRKILRTSDDVIAAAHDIGRAAAPHAARHDREATFAEEGYQAIRDGGFGMIAVPRELGGGGHDLGTVCQAQAVLAGYCANTALAIAMHQHTVLSLAWRWRLGDRAVEHTLRRIVADELLLSSSGAADHANPGITALPVPGGLLVSGRKRLCSGVPGADVVATLARVHDSERSCTATVLIPTSDPGTEIIPGWDAMGMRGSGSNAVSFTEVFVPDADVLMFEPLSSLPGRSASEVSPGASAGQSHWLPGLHIALAVIASVYLGTASATSDRALRLAAGRDESDPALQRLAGQLTQELRVAWWTLDALVADTTDDSLGTQDHFITTMLAKRQIVLSSIRVVELALELLGSRSYDRSLPFEQALRDVRAGITHPLPPEKTLIEVGRSVLQNAAGRPPDGHSSA
ncbi:MAG TPA: DUF692 family protein [Streptosporangiaceae bacterium]|nr:DUF692 family protein [Streptosporangiaceae bacterium]